MRTSGACRDISIAAVVVVYTLVHAVNLLLDVKSNTALKLLGNESDLLFFHTIAMCEQCWPLGALCVKAIKTGVNLV